MSGRVLNITNNSSLVTSEMLATFVSDLNDYLASDFLDGWSISALATIGGTDGYPVLLLDEPQAGDPSGALGFHDIDANFDPYARVFVGLSQTNNIHWSLPTSHEVLEMLADALTNQIVFIGASNGTNGWLVYEEICDPVETLSKQSKNGFALSAFVLPGWYKPGYPGKVDNLGILTRALQIYKGGYAVADAVVRAYGWQEFTMQQTSQRFSTRRLQKVHTT